MDMKRKTKKPVAKKMDKIVEAVNNLHVSFCKFVFAVTEASTSPECAVAVVSERIHLEMGMYLDAVHRAERKARAAMKKGGAK